MKKVRLKRFIFLPNHQELSTIERQLLFTKCFWRKIGAEIIIYLEIPSFEVHLRCANVYNCLGPILGRWWNTEASFDMPSLDSFCLMDLRGLRLTKYAYVSLLTLTKQVSLVTFCDTIAGIGSGTRGEADRMPYGRTDVMIEIVI